MPDESSNTEVITKTSTSVASIPPSMDSQLFGISVRAWIVLMCVGAAVFTQMMVTVAVLIDALFINKDWAKVGTYTNISEPLYGCIMITIGFFFGQKTTKT